MAEVHAVVRADRDDAAVGDDRGVVADAYDPVSTMASVSPHPRRARRLGEHHAGA